MIFASVMKSRLPLIEAIAATCAVGVALWFAHSYAPVESVMGIVQKIFYFHVPSAYVMYLAWLVCTIASIIFLLKGNEKMDMLASSSAEIALLFAVMVMTTGPLWGRKSWGAFWVWDPRLTSALLLTMIILSYVVLRGTAKGESIRKFSAALAIVGACVIPLVHLSVHIWRGQHPSVLKGGGLAPEMLTAFGVCMGAFTILFVVMLRWRYRLEDRLRELGELRDRALAADPTANGGTL